MRKNTFVPVLLLLVLLLSLAARAEKRPSSSFRDELVDRFSRYVKVDTQSQEDTGKTPSTEKQFELARMLADELKQIGLEEVNIDALGFVTATLPATLPPEKAAEVPVIGLLAHMDTSPEAPGANVKPVLHRNYDGKDIVLPGDPTQVIRLAETPELSKRAGHDLITSDGTTLLGADDKAGIAVLMTALHYLKQHPEVPHGKVRVAFTVDEETGTGITHFDLDKFGARYAYTFDGGQAPEMENETWNADRATITFIGRIAHAGRAKGKMISAVRAAASFIEQLPANMLAETTSGRDGFVYPYRIEGGIDRVKLTALLRDFTMEGLKAKEEMLEKIRQAVMATFPGLQIRLEIAEQYRNMKHELDKFPQVLGNAMTAARRIGLEPQLKSIRGGTDGANMTLRGVPTPNIFSGGGNYHSRLEYVSVNEMEQSALLAIELVKIWAEK